MHIILAPFSNQFLPRILTSHYNHNFQFTNLPYDFRSDSEVAIQFLLDFYAWCQEEASMWLTSFPNKNFDEASLTLPHSLLLYCRLAVHLPKDVSMDFQFNSFIRGSVHNLVAFCCNN